jgi:hypothetical protein
LAGEAGDIFEVELKISETPSIFNDSKYCALFHMEKGTNKNIGFIVLDKM